MINDREGLVKFLKSRHACNIAHLDTNWAENVNVQELADALIRECPGIYLQPLEEEQVAEVIWRMTNAEFKINKNGNAWVEALNIAKSICRRFSSPDRSKWIEREKVLEWIENNETNHYEILNANALKAFIREEGK